MPRPVQDDPPTREERALALKLLLVLEPKASAAATPNLKGAEIAGAVQSNPTPDPSISPSVVHRARTAASCDARSSAVYP